MTARMRASPPCARTSTATRGAGRCSATASDRRSRLAGWVHRRRDHGGLVFIDLRDRTGLVQLVFQPRRRGRGVRARAPAAPRGRDLRRRRGRPPRSRDGQCRASDRRVRGPGPEATLLADAETPPFEIEGFSGEVGEEIRLRYRYLDLRRRSDAGRDRAPPPGREGDPRLPLRRGLPRGRDADAVALDAGGRARLPRPLAPRARVVLRAAAVAAALQAAADGRRFRALLPDRPLLSRRGPARRPPARLHPARHRDVVRRGRGRARPQRAHAGGGLATRRRPGARAAAARGSRTTRRWRGSAPTGRTCASGSNWSSSPTCSPTTEFKVFRGAVDAGGVDQGDQRRRPRRARGRCSTASSSRAQELGAKGLVWAFREGDGWRSPTAKFLSADELAALNDRLGAAEGDLLLLVADKPAVANSVLGQLRLELGERFELIDPEAEAFCWIIEWPMFEWNEGERAGTRSTTRSPPAAPGSSTPSARARRGRSPTTSSGTARRWAAARSGSPTRRSSSRCSRRSGSARRGPRPVRLLARGVSLRRAAARRDRLRARPDRPAPYPRRLDP